MANPGIELLQWLLFVLASLYLTCVAVLVVLFIAVWAFFGFRLADEEVIADVG